jgi:hypothetical protein
MDVVFVICSLLSLFSEKQDGKEKESEERIPPLPKKKRGHVASSKQEKEVENLTEKQRSMVEQSSTSMSHKPRIAKLRALFERSLATRESRSSQSKQRTSQLIVRSHSLGAVRIKTENQEDQVVVKAEGHREVNINGPILCHGIVRAPQLSTVQGSTLTVRPTLPVKRSKSLKVLGSNQHCKLSLARAVSPVTSLNTSDDRVSTEASATSVKLPVDRVLLSRGESASCFKPFVPPKKYLTATSGEVIMSEPDNDNCRSSKQDKQFISHVKLDWRNYEGNHIVPRRRRSLESVNLEDAAVSDGSGLNGHDLLLPPSQVQLADGDAFKVVQDCKDYLVSSMKGEVSFDKPGKIVQNSEAADNLTLEAQRKVNAIVAGLGVRERRNSFRQAVGTSREEMRSGRKLRDYEAIWPSGNIVATSLNGNSIQTQESFSSGSSGNVISDSSSTAGSNLMHSQLQQRKGKLSNWLQIQPAQNTRDDKFQQPNERQFSSLTSELTKNRLSQVKGLSRELSASEQNTNAYIKVDNSNIRLGKLGVQPKHLLSSKVLMTPDRRGLHHSQMGTDPGFSASKSTSSGVSLSVDAKNIFPSGSQHQLTVQGQKSTPLGPRKPKNTQNSRYLDFKAHPNQERSLQTAAHQERKTIPCGGILPVTGSTSAKEASYSGPSVSCHRNVTGLAVSHGPFPRVGSAVQNKFKSLPAVGDVISRCTEVNSSTHTAVPFIQTKKQYNMQEISYGMYFTHRRLLILSHSLFSVCRCFEHCFQEKIFRCVPSFQRNILPPSSRLK